MPIFAYRCRACGKQFQTLVRSGEAPVCEACHSSDLDQQLSLIATPNKGSEGAQKRMPAVEWAAALVAIGSAQLLACNNTLVACVN
jgi:putative FmdB family regulatory protein